MHKNILSFPSSEPTPCSTAKVVDGRLVLSLTDAIKPVVWQFDLSVAKSSAIELRETNGGETTLTLKTAKQDVQDIATYDTAAKATKALLAISRAMERASGQMHAAQAGTYPPPAVIPQPNSIKQSIVRGFWNMISTLTTLLILFIIFMVGVWFIPPFSNNNSAPTEQPTEQSIDNTPIGTPQSADEFLTAP